MAGLLSFARADPKKLPNVSEIFCVVYMNDFVSDISDLSG